MLYALRYTWRVTRGHRLRPWRSPYLWWRLETFLGSQALPPKPSAGAFCRLCWQYRDRLRAFLHWAEEVEGHSFRPG